MPQATNIGEDTKPADSFPDESLFLIRTSDPWYGDITLYIQTQIFWPKLSREDHRRIHYHVK